MFDLHGKTALVTGSTQGIGLAIAKQLHEAGADVIIHGATSEEKCIKAMNEVGCKRYVTKNLAEPDAADFIYEKTGDVDILVLNASVQYRKTWIEITPEEFETQILSCYDSEVLSLYEGSELGQNSDRRKRSAIPSSQGYGCVRCEQVRAYELG